MPSYCKYLSEHWSENFSGQRVKYLFVKLNLGYPVSSMYRLFRADAGFLKGGPTY